MFDPRHRRQLGLVATVLVATAVVAGCGRLNRLTGGGPAASAPIAAATATPEATSVAAGSGATPAPSTGPTVGPEATAAATPWPSPAPVATPDLTAIQQLLDELDGALGADATADANEGSPQ